MTLPPTRPEMSSGADLVISEIFGPTFQGEGPSLGRQAGFVRLGRCLLDCRWCDSAFSWDWSRYDPAVELDRRPVADVVRSLEAMAVTNVVITGGEPLLQQASLVDLVAACHERRWRVEVETAGVLAPALDIDQWNVSPKLANSGVAVDRRYKPDVLRLFQDSGKAAFKFVATAPAELEEIAVMVDECGLTNIWVMPEGTSAEVVTAGLVSLAPAVLARGWNLTTRLHILVWGDRRGV